jgi:hypothetical protein
MEVVKQIIDLGELFYIANDVNDIRQSFIKATGQENGFRGTSFSVDEVLDDVTDIAFKYSQFLLKGADNSFLEIKLVNEGLNRVANHLRVRIGQQNIKVAFAKIAYIANVLRSKDKSPLIKTVNMSSLNKTSFTGKYKVLERLKVINPEAYFYWAMAVGTK